MDEDRFDDRDDVELEDARKLRRQIEDVDIMNVNTEDALAAWVRNEMHEAVSEMLNRKIWRNPMDRWILQMYRPHWRPTIGWWDNPQPVDEETRIELFFKDFPGLEEEWNARRMAPPGALP